MTMMEPKIDDLLEQVDSKYTLVIMAAKRARQINAYYSQLGEGIGEYVPPLVPHAPDDKALSTALKEISAQKVAYERVAEGIK
jgi:DNA-directed RNA polymerase subunit omega